MSAVPPYLLVYLWQIRKGSGESAYLKRRLQDKGPDRAVYEKAMLRELSDLHLIALPDKEDHLVFADNRLELDGAALRDAGRH